MTKAWVLTIAASAAAAACLGTAAPAQSLADIEAANERLVRSFYAGASTDPGFYRAFLAQDVVFRYEDVRVEGLDAFVARAAPKLASVKSYEMEPGRLAAIGDTVLSERFDVATLTDGRQVRLRVVSVFLVAGGKIAEWREYPLPEAAP